MANQDKIPFWLTITSGILTSISLYIKDRYYNSGACPGFLKGGSNISWFPKKKVIRF